MQVSLCNKLWLLFIQVHARDNLQYLLHTNRRFYKERSGCALQLESELTQMPIIPSSGCQSRFSPPFDKFFSGKHSVQFLVNKMQDFWNFAPHICRLIFDTEQVYL